MISLRRHRAELEITEGRSTGIPKILRAMKKNGSPPPEFKFDEDHSYFLVRLPAHPKEKSIPRQEDATPQVRVLLLAMKEGEKSRKELMSALQLRGRDNFEKLYLLAALSECLIERTIPDKPNSRLQKYRLTAQGHHVLGPRE
jgi:ATP-dependent DNA helicase RecG